MTPRISAQARPDSTDVFAPAPPPPELDTVTFDAAPGDTAALDSAGVPLVYALSPDALDGTVAYTMRDSMHYDVRAQKIYLYGAAEVRYLDVTLKAGRMTIDYAENLVVAEPAEDSVGNPVEVPNFEQGAQAFDARGLRYNFKTGKGIITNAKTKQGDLFVLGGQTKIVAADDADPTRADDKVYNADAIITTCELDHPHYGIRSSKQKVIPGKQVIVGPSNVELGGVPTPLWLPFGFFPIGSSEQSGLLFPKDYTYTDVDGFGFQQIGWYFPWNDKWHTAATVDVFLKGTLRGDFRNSYSNRYKYQGRVDAGFARNRTEVAGVEGFLPSFYLNWSHTQDRKANPYRTFSANVNFQTGGYAQRNIAASQVQLANDIRSNVSYSIRFPEHPSWTASLGLAHSQKVNNTNRFGGEAPPPAIPPISLQFPNARFSTGQTYPFANAPGPSTAWYKKATLDYTANVRGSVQAYDSTLFDAKTWEEDALFGGQHSVNFTAPVNVLKYFRLSPNVGYDETYYLKQRVREFRTELVARPGETIITGTDTIVTDTTFEQVGSIFDTIVRPEGFAIAARTFTANLSLTTNIYGTARFKLGPLRGLRHIITPRISAGYVPDYSAQPFRYYDDVVRTVDDEFVPYVDPATGETVPFLRFPNQPFSSGLSDVPQEARLGISYSLGNRLETKLQGRNDSVAEVTTLLNGLNFAGSYNPRAEEFKWSPINVSGAQLSFFKKLVRVSFGGRLDLYDRTPDGTRLDTLLIDRGRFPVVVDNFRLNLGTTFSLRQLRDIVTGTESTPVDNSIFTLVDAFRFSYNFARGYDSRRPEDARWTTTANSVNVSGSIPLTEKWSITGVTLGYDLRNEQLTYPTLSIGRDLHCWEMDFYWAPAFNNTFTFSIRVKPSSLSFLELPYRRNAVR